MTTPTNQSDNGPNLWTVLAAILVVAGCLLAFVTSQRLGVDYASFEITSRALIEGWNVYEPGQFVPAFAAVNSTQPPGMFYPPATGFFFAPFALLPYTTGRTLWLVTMLVVLVAGLWAALRALRPAQPNEGRDGRSVRAFLFVIAAVLFSAGIRWGFTPLQPAPMVLGLFCLFLWALEAGRRQAVFWILILAVCIKLTSSLPFIGLALLYRRYRTLGAALALFVVLNAVGFMRMGGADAVRSYRGNMKSVEARYNINSPNPRDFASIERPDWTYLFTGLTGSEKAGRAISAALTLGVAAWLVFVGWRLGRRPAALVIRAYVGPLACLGMLGVYHHHYDLSMLIAPLLIYWFGLPREYRSPAMVCFTVVVVAFVGFYPVGAVQNIVVRRFGEDAMAYVKVVGSLVTSTALVCSCIILNNVISRRVPENSPAEEPSILATAPGGHAALSETT